MSSIDDPILKELLDALKQDTQLMASDLLSVITTQALIAVFALFLAIASTTCCDYAKDTRDFKPWLKSSADSRCRCLPTPRRKRRRDLPY